MESTILACVLSERSRTYLPMKRHLLFTLLLPPCMAFAQGWTQVGLDLDGEAADDQFGNWVSMPDAQTVAVGAYWNNGNGNNSGQVRVYAWSGGAWGQKGVDLDGEGAEDYSGSSVSMPDANTVAIGAFGNADNGSWSGHVRVYAWSGGEWMQKGEDLDGEAAGDYSGWSVSMPDANTVAAGAIWNDGNGNTSGHVRVHAWNGNAWVQKGTDLDGEAADDQSGYCVSMPDANTVAIGAPWNDDNGADAGHVRVFEWSDSAWVQKGEDLDGEAAHDLSGYSVNMPDANTVAIATPQNDGNGIDAGHVRVYEWSGNAWVQKGEDLDGEAAGDGSGRSVSMPDANTVAVGAPLNGGSGAEAGQVRVYAWEGNAWVQQGTDLDGESAGDWSGLSVSMPDVNTVAIGAPTNAGNTPGQVRVYSALTTSTSESDADHWTVHPNPTSGPLTVKVGQAHGELMVSTANALGQEVDRLHLNAVAKEFELSLNGPSGVYTVTVVPREGPTSRLKVIKQ
jgi:hypothetical protein